MNCENVGYKSTYYRLAKKEKNKETNVIKDLA